MTKPARHLRLVEAPREYRSERATVRVVRRDADAARHQRLVRLLAVLLDKPDAPEEG